MVSIDVPIGVQASYQELEVIHKNSFTLLFILGLLSGCAQTDEFRNWRSLTDQQRQQVKAARAGCPVVDVISGELRFVAAPVINDDNKADIELAAAQEGLPDRQMLISVWGQRLCLLSKLGPQIKGTPKWRREVGDAIAQWPTFNSATYDQQILALTTKRDAHIAQIYKDYGNEKTIEAIPGPVLLAAFPFRDFLNIKTADVEIRSGKSIKIKGQKIGGAGKICLTSAEYSTAIRPALDQTRTAVVAIGSRTMSEAEALDLMVTTVYEAGATRMYEAKLASDLQTAPVVCALEKPQAAKPKEDGKKDGGKAADDKKADDKKADDKKADDTKPGNKEAGNKEAGNKEAGSTPPASGAQAFPSTLVSPSAQSLG